MSWQVPASETRNRLRALAEMAVAIAEREVGHGEAPGRNNQGPHVERFRRGAGLPPGKGSWCAVFVSYAYAEAARELNLVLPFVPSQGAKALARAVAGVGRYVDLDVEVPEVGDVICWHRGPRVGPLSWQGHVGLVVGTARSGALTWIDGNAGQAPSPVARRVASFDRWTRKLYRVARLA